MGGQEMASNRLFAVDNSDGAPPEEACRLQKMLGRDVLRACLMVQQVQLVPWAMSSCAFPSHALHVDVLRRPACNRQRLRTGALASAGCVTTGLLGSRMVGGSF